MPIEPVQTSRTGVARRYGLTGVRGRNNAVTLGNKATAGADGVTVVGDSASATAASVVAIGRSASVLAASSVAIGPSALAASTSAVAVGNAPAASGASAVAVGNAVGASGASAVAIGNGASGSGANAVAVGNSAIAGNSGAVAIGNGASGSNTSAVGVGNSAAASGNSSVALGALAAASGTGSVSLGNATTAGATNATALGVNSNASRYGQHATANGQFSAAGDAQLSQYVMRRQTTDATPTEVTSDNSTTGFVTLAAVRTMSVTIKIAAHRTDVSGTAAAWPLIQAAITRDSTGNCRLLGSVSGAGTTSFCDAGALTWSVAVTADTTNNRLAITVTGEAAKTIRWVATVDMAEVG